MPIVINMPRRLRPRAAPAWGVEPSYRPDPTPESLERQEALVPYESAAPVPANESGVSLRDLQSLRDAMITTIRADREQFLLTVRDALKARDQEIAALRGEVGSMRRAMEQVRSGLEGVERRLGGMVDPGEDAGTWAELIQRDGRQGQGGDSLAVVIQLAYGRGGQVHSEQQVGHHIPVEGQGVRTGAGQRRPRLMT